MGGGLSVRVGVIAALVLWGASAFAAPLPASVEVVRVDEPIRVAPNLGAERRGAAERGARLPVFAETTGSGCAGVWFAVGAVAWICEEGVVRSGLAPSGVPAAPSMGGLPYSYRFVGPDGSFGYRTLETAEEGVPDAQLLPEFGIALTRMAAKPEQSELFGLTTHRLWVPMRDLGPSVQAPPALAVDVSPADVAWVSTPRASVFVRAGGPAKRGVSLEALTRVVVLERVVKQREPWLRVGEGEWLRGRDATWPVLKPPPAEIEPNERWIDVDLARQVVTAYQGPQPLFSMPASTGRGPAGTEQATPPGVHRIWIKLQTSDMDNLEALDSSRLYAIQSVPWVMYFERGYGLHGAFWHRAFGRVHSHGCVNLTPADAERLFAWTSPRLPAGWSAVLPTSYERGTLVRVE